MKIFISSFTRGFEAFRHAAAAGVAILGHHAICAEDFGASPDSPQQACLAGVRNADTMILILGSHYGSVQASGLSATHEEYREARDVRPVLVFIQQSVDPEPQQHEFIDEVQSWEQGHYIAEFRNPEGLRDKIIRVLHDYILANEAASLDEAELASRAQTLVPNGHSTGSSDLVVTIAGGPLRAILRPAELESEHLHRFLLAEALTGAYALLTPSLGTDVSVRGDAYSSSRSRDRVWLPWTRPPISSSCSLRWRTTTGAGHHLLGSNGRDTDAPSPVCLTSISQPQICAAVLLCTTIAIGSDEAAGWRW